MADYTLEDAAVGLGLIGGGIALGALASYALNCPAENAAPGVAGGIVAGGAAGIAVAALSPNYRAAGITSALVAIGFLAGSAVLVAATKPKAV